MKNAKFIVFEGLDASGKSTISKRFAKQHNLQLLGAIPPEIKAWLPKLSATKLPEATFSYFTLCNLLMAQKINDILAKGESLVLDRYFYTSYTYHTRLLKAQMPEAIKKVYNFPNLPKPDFVVFLDVPQSVRTNRIKERSEDLQWYGDAVSMQFDLTQTYFDLFEELKVNVIRIDNHKNSIQETLAIINQHYS